jgi:hypothetical protein
MHNRARTLYNGYYDDPGRLKEVTDCHFASNMMENFEAPPGLLDHLNRFQLKVMSVTKAKG